MIIVRLNGGLGNQMFQYALGRACAIKNDTELAFDISGFKNSILKINLKYKNTAIRKFDLSVYNIDAEIVKVSFFKKIILFKKKILSRFFGIHFRNIEKKMYSFDQGIFSYGKNAYFDGYWQSYRYFENIRDVIIKDFTLKQNPDQKSTILLDEIGRKNSLAIHIRRGDYVGNAYHNVVGQEYYEKSIQYVKDKNIIDKIYIFSDDIVWCEENLKFSEKYNIPISFVDDSYAGRVGEGHMNLMMKCKYFIIANSSFSWWGAWLSQRENKVIVSPKEWLTDTRVDTSDLIPKEWVRL